MHILAYAFDGYTNALEAREALKRYDHQHGSVKLGNMAIVGKTPDGNVVIDETRDLKYNPRLIGSIAFAGLAAGVLLGALQVVSVPPRVLALAGGAAGVAAGVVITYIDAGFPDKALRQLGAGLAAGTTVLVLLAEPHEAVQVGAQLSQRGGRAISQSLAPEVVTQLLSAARPATPPPDDRSAPAGAAPR